MLESGAWWWKRERANSVKNGGRKYEVGKLLYGEVG